MKTGLLMFGLLSFISILIGPAYAQQVNQVPPPPNGAAPYMVPPQVPVGAPIGMPVPMPPSGYGAGPDGGWQGNAAYPPQQFAPWPGPAANAPAVQPVAQMPPQAYAPQGYGAPDAMPMPQQPASMSRYEQQEAAIRESQMVEQLEDVKQQKEMEESFRHSVLAEFDDGKNGTPNSGFNGDQSKVKTAGQKAGKALKTGMRWCAPTASYIGTFFILRGITGGF